MPVTADSFLWEATGLHASGTSVVVTHPDAGGTTAGTTVVVLFNGAFAFSAVPAGFVSMVANNAYYKSDVDAGETSWTFTMVATGSSSWYMAELDDLMLVDPADTTNIRTTATTANGATKSTGTSGMNAGSTGIAFAVMGAIKAGGTDVQSWSGWTNSFAERVDVAPSSGTTGYQIAVATKFFDGFSTHETTATFATSVASASTASYMILLRSADASINAPLDYLTTFGFGTHAGMGNLGNSPLGAVPATPTGTWGTGYSVGAVGRDGRTGLQITNSAFLHLPTVAAGRAAFSGNVCVVSGSGTVSVLLLDTPTSNDLLLMYDVATEKFGLVWRDNVATFGTTEWQTGITPLGTFAWVDIRMRVETTTHSAAWSIETGTGDGTQIAPTADVGTVQSSVLVTLGTGAAQTAVFKWSDVVYTRYAGAHPLGPHVVRVLAPETTGATVSGTSSNFSKFTANGTLAAWAGDAGALLDDIPPTVSASSDGVVQTAVAASDYMNFPMTTYTLASDEIIAGVRAFTSLWGGTGSGAGTLGFRGHDGTTETTFVAAGTSFDPDSLTTASATYPLWYTAMWSAGTAWNQTKLDAAALRGGFSTDATPDMGFSCMGLEVAIAKARYFVKYRLVDGEDPTNFQAAVYEYINPYNSGTRSFGVDNQDATRSCVFTWTDSLGPHSVTVDPSDPIEVVTIDEDAVGNVTDTSFAWVP